MPLIDISQASQRAYDVCIIGSGPAGTAAALFLAESNHSVVLVDAGDKTPMAGPGASYSSDATHAALHETNCRAYGGTSWMWGGRIMPFVEKEFREYGWPVSFDDYAQYLDKAAIFLGGSVLERPFVDAAKKGHFDLDAVEMQAAEGPVSLRHSNRLNAKTGPDVLLSTSAVGLNVISTPDGDPYCRGVKLRSSSSNATFDLTARITIVACGGIETARLLLAEQTRQPTLLGHLRRLGQGYSGHLTGSISRISLPKHKSPIEFGWQPYPQGDFRRRVFRTTAAGMAVGPNMFFWARNWPIEAADHGSGIQSLKHVLSVLKYRKSLTPAAEPKPKASPLTKHIRNLILDVPTSVKAVPALLRAKYNKTRSNLDHLIPNSANCYKLCYHSEQSVSHNNRIDIVGPVATDHLPDIKITFDYSDMDIGLVVRGHEMLAQELDKSGVAKLVHEFAERERHDAIRQRASDGYHQIGTARMGQNATDSVLDGNCKLHGITGVYLAGSSIFSSSGAVPPTQSIVAFSMRLAQHLSSVLKTTAKSQTSGEI